MKKIVSVMMALTMLAAALTGSFWGVLILSACALVGAIITYLSIQKQEQGRK